jgi:hypothetical protein
MRFLDRESLRVVLLNTKQHLITVCTVSQGSVNESLTHPREVFKPPIVIAAYSFIMVHNHPSGDPAPSEADMRLTRRILEASRILQLQLLDHVIIGAPRSGPDQLLPHLLLGLRYERAREKSFALGLSGLSRSAIQTNPLELWLLNQGMR